MFRRGLGENKIICAVRGAPGCNCFGLPGVLQKVRRGDRNVQISIRDVPDSLLAQVARVVISKGVPHQTSDIDVGAIVADAISERLHH
jgi:KaiC/GvpD/RAD55 family RecA-like ATPase